MIYTGSHDKSVRVWDAVKGTLVHNFTAHGHWVNHLALSSDHVLRTAYFDHTKEVPDTEEGKRAKARERFEKAAKIQGKVAERLVSASDDFTMYLWDPTNNGNKPVARLLGHQNKVNQVQFSPDGTLISSAGWDNSTVSSPSRIPTTDTDLPCRSFGMPGMASSSKTYEAMSRRLVNFALGR
jgi:ribosome assembly protein 4